MGCLYLKIEGQSCLVGIVDQGLMKNRLIDLLDRMTQKRATKTHFRSVNIFPIATKPGIFQPIYNPKKTFQTLRPNYRRSICGVGWYVWRPGGGVGGEERWRNSR